MLKFASLNFIVLNGAEKNSTKLFSGIILGSRMQDLTFVFCVNTAYLSLAEGRVNVLVNCSALNSVRAVILRN